MAAAVAVVVVDMLFLLKVFLGSFVMVDCIDHSYHFYVEVCNHSWHSSARVDSRHLYMNQIAVADYWSDSYNSVAHRPYFWRVAAVLMVRWKSRMEDSTHRMGDSSWVIVAVMVSGRFCP